MLTLPLIATIIPLVLVAPYSSKQQIHSAKEAKVTIVSPNNTHLMMRVEYNPEPPLPIFPGKVTEVNPRKK
jgi:hypothetical protein